MSSDQTTLGRKGFSDRSLSTVVAQCYVRLSTHCAREAGGSNGAPKTQIVLAILPDRTSMMLITCHVTPSGYLAFPKNVQTSPVPSIRKSVKLGPRIHLSSLPTTLLCVPSGKPPG